MGEFDLNGAKFAQINMWRLPENNYFNDGPINWCSNGLSVCLLIRNVNHKPPRKELKRIALEYALEKLTIKKKNLNYEINANQGGQLASKDGEKLAWANVSHSEYASVAVINLHASVGVDIEPANRIVGREVLKSLIKLPSKMNTLEMKQENQIFLWCSIEAVCKATGHGLNALPDLKYISSNKWAYDDQIYFTYSKTIKIESVNHLIVIAVKH